MSRHNECNPICLNVASSWAVLENCINLDNSIFLWLLPFHPVLKFFLKSKHLRTIELYKRAKSKAKLLKHDCRKPLKFQDASVDHILCSHFLEHVYPDQARKIVRDFHRVLKKGGTLHVIVPDLAVEIDKYIDNRGHPEAANTLIKNTILSHEKSPSFVFRLLEFVGGFGLQHRWMYDQASATQLLLNAGFCLAEDTTSPTEHYRDDDASSVHVLVRKP